MKLLEVEFQNMLPEQQNVVWLFCLPCWASRLLFEVPVSVKKEAKYVLARCAFYALIFHHQSRKSYAYDV